MATRCEPRPVRLHVKALSTSNLTLSGAQTIDGVSCVAGDLVGALGQTDGKNAVYLVQSSTWIVVDPGVGTGLEVYATSGSSNVNKLYAADTASTITWGTTSVTFTLKASGGGAFSPGAPGAIGGTTPAAITGTTITANTNFLSTRYDISGAVLPTPTDGVTKLFGSQYTAGQNAGIGLLNQYGSALYLRMLAATATGLATVDVLPLQLADDATYDYENASRGGFAIVAALGATGSTWGACSFAQNGATSVNGLAFTDFDVADTDTKLCAFASGGKLRIRNRLGSTQDILLIVFSHRAN